MRLISHREHLLVDRLPFLVITCLIRLALAFVQVENVLGLIVLINIMAVLSGRILLFIILVELFVVVCLWHSRKFIRISLLIGIDLVVFALISHDSWQLQNE